MREVVDAGIDFIRISVIGYNKTLYNKWMNIDNFDLILSNLIELKKYVTESNSNTQVSTYHLVTDNSKVKEEIELYKNNVINKVNTIAYIWKMHNWSGNHDNINPREKTNRRSCGRPFAPELTIRAGGSAGRTGAIVPCCQTLGPPREEASILGHLDQNSFEEIYFGKAYEDLRKAHEEKNFDKIDYCKDCDFLYEDPEAIVWTNDKEHKLYNMLGTGDNFILTDYKKR